MTILRFKKAKIVISIIIIIFVLFLFSIVSTCNQNVEDVKFMGNVNVNTLNLRQGPGIKFDIIKVLKKNDVVNVIGKINDWYIVQTAENIFGLCNTKYIENSGEYPIEKSILNAINEKRENKKIKKLTLDNRLSEIAKIKAQDIIDNHYFTHESKKLGTPFDMLNKYDITFMTVGENIAKSNNVEDFITLVTQSQSYMYNSLSNDYNYTGIAILPIDEYDYIYVQLFIGRQ